MLAAPIVLLPHQIASIVLFAYAGLAVVFTKYPPKKPPQPVRLTHLDVDIRFCDSEELQYMKTLLQAQATSSLLNGREIVRFEAICKELEARNG
jgi:hypothetical protein